MTVPLAKVQNGYRLPAGEWFNTIIARVNAIVAGTVTGAYKGTFDGILGGTTSAAATVTTLTSSGVLTPTGGMIGAGGFSTPRVWHTGEVAPTTTTTGNDTTPVVTEIYVARVFIPTNTTVTGLALLNGSAVAGNIQGALYDSSGALVGSTASTAQSGTAAYQQVALSAPVAVKGPATYYISWSFNNTGARFRSHILGNFNAGKLTGQVYGTVPATITPPTTFTANLGPISDSY